MNKVLVVALLAACLVNVACLCGHLADGDKMTGGGARNAISGGVNAAWLAGSGSAATKL